jgi:thioredoxin-related protein
MKSILPLLFVCITCAAYAQEKTISAEIIIKEACSQAAKEGKNVFILFHASWCGWCHKMDTAMNDAKVRDMFTSNYIIRHIVVHEFEDKKKLENPGAEMLLKKYKGDGQGIPYWIIFDKDGKWLADSKIRPQQGGLDSGVNTGCPANEEEVAHFIEVLRKTSLLNTGQLAIIEKRFRENGE